MKCLWKCNRNDLRIDDHISFNVCLELWCVTDELGELRSIGNQLMEESDPELVG